MLWCGFRANNTVVHCMIERRDTGFGFAEPYFIHETLRNLVMYYRETTLVEHNEILDVTLKYPVLAPSSAAIQGPSTPACTVRVCITVFCQHHLCNIKCFKIVDCYTRCDYNFKGGNFELGTCIRFLSQNGMIFLPSAILKMRRWVWMVCMKHGQARRQRSCTLGQVH